MSRQATRAEVIRNADLDGALAEAERRYGAANPQSAKRHEAATRSMPGGNTRTILFYTPFPLTVVKGIGAHIEDADGHDYADFLGEYSAGLYGHSDPVIRQAVTKALEDGIVLGGPNRYEADLAAEICRRFPSLELVRFCNSGTEANLLALSLVRIVTGRRKILVMGEGYHGSLLYFGHGGSPLNVPFDWIVAPFNDAAGTKALMEAHGADLAAVLVEPMQGSGGCIAATPEFLGMLRSECTRLGAILIFDEVMTSRLSFGGLQARFGITPDMTTLGKYLGGGLTFGAFGGRRDIMERLDPRRPDPISHAGTFNNNVMAMAGGIAGLSQVLTREASDRVNRDGENLRERLTALARKHDAPVQLTGIGSLIGVHFSRRPVQSNADLETGGADMARRRAALQKLFHLDLIDHGVYMARRGYIALSLPMVAADYDRLAGAFEEFLETRGPVLEATVD
jgi:glutamate-1-semialdehyde 2,1-aminomutase